MPARLTLDIGTRVQSLPAPGELPQTFELVEPLAEARPAWNALRPWLSEAHLPAAGDREAWLAGVATGLKPGDALLLVGDEYFATTASDNWDFRLLSAVEPDPANDRTRVRWARGLGSQHPKSLPPKLPHVFALRTRAAVFGNNAPIWRTMNADYRAGYVKVYDGSADQAEWPGFVISRIGADDTSGGAVDLDQLHAEIGADVPGDTARRSFAVLARGGFNRPDEDFPSGTYVELYRVTGTGEVARAEFGISAKVSRLEVAGENLATAFRDKVRATGVFARSEPLPLAERPVTAAVAGDRIPRCGGCRGAGAGPSADRPRGSGRRRPAGCGAGHAPRGPPGRRRSHRAGDRAPARQAVAAGQRGGPREHRQRLPWRGSDAGARRAAMRRRRSSGSS